MKYQNFVCTVKCEKNIAVSERISFDFNHQGVQYKFNGTITHTIMVDKQVQFVIRDGVTQDVYVMTPEQLFEWSFQYPF